MTYLILAVAIVAVVAPLAMMALSVEDWGRDLTANRAATDPDAQHPLMRPLTQRFTAEELDAVLDAICADNAGVVSAG